MSGSRTAGAFVEDNGGPENMHFKTEVENQGQLPTLYPKDGTAEPDSHIFENHHISLTTADDSLPSSNDQNRQKHDHPTISSSDLKRISTEYDASDLIKKQLKESQAECATLRQKLTDAEDFIFSSQPQQQKVITETEAADELKSLCASVEDWVQTHLGDALEELVIYKWKEPPPSQPARNLLSMISLPGREAFKIKGTDEYNLIAFIMRYLCQYILDKDFYCPVEQGTLEALAKIERSMEHLKVPRDLILRRTWRSETYLALSNRPDFPFWRNKLREKCTSELTTMLRMFQPRASEKDLLSSIQKIIVDPAISLAHRLHLSVDRYTIFWSPYHASKAEGRRNVAQDYSQFTCLDLLSGKKIKFPTRGRVLTYIFDTSPGLRVETVKANFYSEPRIVRKPGILVANTNEEDGPYKPSLSRPRNHPTLLSWLEKTCAVPRHTSYFK